MHKKLREHRLAPVLIREITRRVNLTGRFQAVYTAGRMLPKPVAAVRYWHRSLDPKKLIECGFSTLKPRMTLNRTIKINKVDSKPTTPGLRPMEARDADAVCTLLNAYLAKFNLANKWQPDEVAHWFLPRDEVIYTYVAIDNDNKLTDIISFYNLPSTVINHPKHSQIKAAYSFYIIPNKHSMKQLMNDALVLAKRENFDVFNSLELLDYKSVMRDCNFGEGDGMLQYYCYNFRAPTMPSKEVGLVLL